MKFSTTKTLVADTVRTSRFSHLELADKGLNSLANLGHGGDLGRTTHIAATGTRDEVALLDPESKFGATKLRHDLWQGGLLIPDWRGTRRFRFSCSAQTKDQKGLKSPDSTASEIRSVCSRSQA